MKFEGTQVNIPIKGIMRAGTDNLCADGAMNEVVGMEYKDGSWLPYKEGEESADVVYLDSGLTEHELIIKDVFIHKLTEDSQKHLFISYADQFEAADDDLWYEYEHEGTEYKVEKLASGVKDLSIVGNMLCVSTNNGMAYYLYEEGSYHERQVGYYPQVDLRVTAGLYEKDRTDGVDADLIGMRYVSRIVGVEMPYRDIDKTEITTEAYRASIEGGLAAVRGEVRDRGGLTGYIVACVAYRGKNGKILATSAPVLLSRPYEKLGDNGVMNLCQSGFNRYIYEDNQWVSSLIPDDELKNRPIMQYPLAKELNFNRAEKDMTETGFAKLYKDNQRSFTAIDGDEKTAGVEDIDLGQSSPTSTVVYANDLEGEGQRGMYLYKKTDNDGPYDNNHPIPPSLFCTSVESFLWTGDTISGDVKRDYFFCSYAVGNTLQYRVPVLTAQEMSEIQSICIFMSPEVYPFRTANQTDEILNVLRSSSTETIYHYEEGVPSIGVHNYIDSWARTYYAKQRNLVDIVEEIRNIKSLYLVKEVNLNEITPSDDWISIDLKGLLGDTLNTLESLPLTSFLMDSYSPEHLDAYNYRLHMYDYAQRLFKGYTLPQLGYHGGEGQYDAEELSSEGLSWEIDVELDDDDGTRRVVRYDASHSETLNKLLSPLLTYPSDKAVSMTVKVFDHEDERWYEKTYALRNNMGLGIAYYIDQELKPIAVDVLESAAAFPDTIPTAQEKNTERKYENGLKVSDVANPSFFPAEFTYRMGNRSIIGLARLTTPVSQDNFGNNQLIIFCTDGIYSMTVDPSGNGAYTSIPPLVSPEVCVNRNSICEIGGAVLFASDKGLMILTGANGVEQFTPHLNGQPRFLPAQFSSKEADGIYRKMIDSTQILSEDDDQFGDSISLTDFADFIREQDTHLIYISIKNKLLAYNKYYDYAYFIDIATRNTTKLTMSALCDDKSLIGRQMWELVYADTDADADADTEPSIPQFSYRLHEFGYMSESDDKIPCLIVTRPIKVQQDDKCSYRVVLTGYFEGILDNWACLVVLGSLDADHWRVIGVKEKKLVDGFHNLGCLTERGSWKYLMFIFAGKLTNDSHIDSVDITVDGKYNNKKR